MPDTYTDRKDNLLTPYEANQILREHRMRAGIPLNTWAEEPPTGHPVVPTILDELGHDQQDRCPVCRMRGGSGFLRIGDLPVNHPQFGRYVRCHRCNNGY